LGFSSEQDLSDDDNEEAEWIGDFSLGAGIA